MTQPTLLKITEDSIDVDDLILKITEPTTGAVVVFTGIVRGVTMKEEGQVTSSMDYEAYQPMALEKMQQVAEEIREKWQVVDGIAIVQRVGRLDAGTPTTVIACASGHRDSGVFEAARYGIDRLKEIVPIWKREIGPGREGWVEGHYHPQPGE